MRSIVVSSGVLGLTLVLAGEPVDLPTHHVTVAPGLHETPLTPEVDPNEVVANTCVRCHSDARLRRTLSLA